MEHPSSLAVYCKKSIPAMLLDRILQDKYGLSYSQFAAVQRKRKIEQRLFQMSGKKPTDQQTAIGMKISLDRLYQIENWESQLSSYSIEEDWDSEPPRQNDE
jgi:hypothetical protein